MEETLVQCISYSLENLLYANAIFLAERLYAFVANERTLQLLALCHYRAGKPNKVYLLLREAAGLPSASPELRYLFSCACYSLGKFREAEQCLLLPHSSHSSAELPVGVPGGAAGCFLLGQVCRKLNQKRLAIKYFKKSVELNPFLWSAYEALCSLGADVDAAECFGSAAVGPAQAALFSSTPALPSVFSSSVTVKASLFQTPNISSKQSNSFSTTSSTLFNFSDFSASPSVSSAFQTPCSASLSASSASSPSLTVDLLGELDLNETNPYTPSPLPSSITSSGANKQPPVDLPKRKLRNKHTASIVTNGAEGRKVKSPKVRTTRLSFSSALEGDIATAGKTNGKRKSEVSKRLPYTTKRRIPKSKNTADEVDELALHSQQEQNAAASNLFTPTEPRNSPKLRTKALRFTSTDAASVATDEIGEAHAKGERAARRKLLETPSTPLPSPFNGAPQDPVGVIAVLTLLKHIGNAYRHLCQFRCQHAIEAFQALPPKQYETGWVLCNVGRAYFEMTNHQEAERHYEEVRKKEPYRVEGMEIYSTILWHLRKEVELSFLAQQLTELDRMAPQSWCAVGNCFSLQNEHRTAIKFFHRAIQLDSMFTYAYTLSGHEYVAGDDLDKATGCFRSAIRIDDRHYNAWYGLGIVFYRQEKYDFAEYHFRKALQINGLSSVLNVHMGMAMFANQKLEQALPVLEKAIELNPANTLAKFRKATVLFSLHRYEEALQVLEELADYAPKESAVFFLLGKTHKQLRNFTEAIRCLNVALDLDTKNQAHIKSILDKLQSSHLLEDQQEDEEEEVDDEIIDLT
ncbi:cell division cycle protein 27 [Balamuthia mandrillaris]